MEIVIFATESFIIDKFIIEIFVVEAPGGIPGAFLITLLYIGRSGKRLDYPVSCFGSVPTSTRMFSYEPDTVPQHDWNNIQGYFIQQGRFDQRGYELAATDNLNIGFRT